MVSLAIAMAGAAAWLLFGPAVAAFVRRRGYGRMSWFLIGLLVGPMLLEGGPGLAETLAAEDPQEHARRIWRKAELTSAPPPVRPRAHAVVIGSARDQTLNLVRVPDTVRAGARGCKGSRTIPQELLGGEGASALVP